MKVKLSISNRYAVDDYEDIIEVEDSYIKDMSSAELEDYLQNLALDFMFENIDCNFEIVEG